MKKLICLGILTVLASICQATDVRFVLSEFNAFPATNRVVTLQRMNPFVGNVEFCTSDSNGIFTYSNMPVGVLFNGTIKAPPGMIPFQIYVPDANMGLTDATNVTASGTASTYPGGQVAPTFSAAYGLFAAKGSPGGSATNAVSKTAPTNAPVPSISPDYSTVFVPTNYLTPASAAALYQPLFGWTPQGGTLNLTNWGNLGTNQLNLYQLALGFTPQGGSLNLTNWGNLSTNQFNLFTPTASMGNMAFTNAATYLTYLQGIFNSGGGVTYPFYATVATNAYGFQFPTGPMTNWIANNIGYIVNMNGGGYAQTNWLTNGAWADSYGNKLTNGNLTVSGSVTSPTFNGGLVGGAASATNAPNGTALNTLAPTNANLDLAGHKIFVNATGIYLVDTNVSNVGVFYGPNTNLSGAQMVDALGDYLAIYNHQAYFSGVTVNGNFSGATNIPNTALQIPPVTNNQATVNFGQGNFQDVWIINGSADSNWHIYLSDTNDLHFDGGIGQGNIVVDGGGGFSGASIQPNSINSNKLDAATRAGLGGGSTPNAMTTNAATRQVVTGPVTLTNTNNILAGDASGLTGGNTNLGVSNFQWPAGVPVQNTYQVDPITGYYGNWQQVTDGPGAGSYIFYCPTNGYLRITNPVTGVFNSQPSLGNLALSGTITSKGLMVVTNGSSTPNIIGGTAANLITNNAAGSIIAGGGPVNSIGSSLATIGGGQGNQIGATATYSTVGGGIDNHINALDATIGGGEGSLIKMGSIYSTIAGGEENIIYTNATESAILGGNANQIGNNSFGSTIGAGDYNIIHDNAYNSTIGGGDENQINAGALYATIPGGSQNIISGAYGFAAGQQAQALHQGAFVWADSQNAPFASTTNDQFSVRAQGGVVFSTGGKGLTVDGPITGNGGGMTNTESLTIQAATNLTVTFNGTLQKFVITNTPDFFLTTAGGFGDASFVFTKSNNLYGSLFGNPSVTWIGNGSNSVVSNTAILSVSSYGTNLIRVAMVQP